MIKVYDRDISFFKITVVVINSLKLIGDRLEAKHTNIVLPPINNLTDKP